MKFLPGFWLTFFKHSKQQENRITTKLYTNRLEFVHEVKMIQLANQIYAQ
jgi:hypothetical protein